VRLKRRGRGNARDGLLSANRVACVRDSLHRMVCTRREILKIERKIFFEKERGKCIGWMSRHVDVVCAKVQVHVYGGVATVVVEL
jgi:hypothetical protein